MKITKSHLFEKRASEARERLGYWVRSAKMDFAVALHRLLKQQEISQKELAEKIDTSQAYITKVLSGDVNFTIESMVKLSRAVGGRLRIEIEGVNAESAWRPVAPCGKTISPSSNTAYVPLPRMSYSELPPEVVSPKAICANDGNYAQAA